MPDLFKDWIASINEKDRNIFKEGNDAELSEEYPSFMINRAFSQTADTILAANMVNIRADYMPPQMQYDFLMKAIPKKKRFAKWAKAEDISRINIIMKAFDYSKSKAEAVSSILSDDEIEKIKEFISEGGKSNG